VHRSVYAEKSQNVLGGKRGGKKKGRGNGRWRKKRGGNVLKKLYTKRKDQKAEVRESDTQQTIRKTAHNAGEREGD